MTSEDKGHYAKKHPANTKIDQSVAAALKEKAKDNTISCPVVFKIAEDLDVTPAQAGLTLDFLEISITKCQLGLFGHKDGKDNNLNSMKEVPRDLEGEIIRSLADGKLQCQKAWEIAKKMGLRKMQVSSACEALKIKITSCQLGAFK